MGKTVLILITVLAATVVWIILPLDKKTANNNRVSFHLNQLGYLPDSDKIAAITGAQSDSFTVLDEQGNTVLTGKLSPGSYWDKADQEIRIAEFSSIIASGTYRIKIDQAISDPFKIEDELFTNLVRASAKYYYFNRASTDLPEKYAGPYNRPVAHPDTATVIHETAASPSRAAGTRIQTPKGWYDAGDYNKYVVNSGITMFTLMRAYEQNNTLFDTLTWNIPESGNGIPDLLDEVRWNLDWMITMQDPADGGVYHKNTTAEFEGFIPPHEATSTRYVITKSTAASLDFAAVLARASRIYRKYDSVFAGELVEKATKAWQWASTNPQVIFENPGKSGKYGPRISTGAYGDRSIDDEFMWASAELFITTREQVYLDALKQENLETFRVPSWGAVESLGLITLSVNLPEDNQLKLRADEELLKLAAELHVTAENAPYRIPLVDFRWGSSSDILNQGMILMHGWLLSGNDSFRKDAAACLDYVLGRNALGISLVTGYGNNPPVHPHHRPSASDGVEAPVPGMLIGGPNPNNMDDDCGRDQYPDHHPALAYIDAQCSYSTNEVAINWNAPLVYLSSSVQQAYSR